MGGKRREDGRRQERNVRPRSIAADRANARHVIRVELDFNRIHQNLGVAVDDNDVGSHIREVVG